MAQLSQNLRFFQNAGQWDPEAKFLGKTAGADVWVTNKRVLFDFFTERTQPAGAGAFQVLRKRHVVAMDFVGAKAGSYASGYQALSGTTGYISGNGILKSVPYQESKINGIYDKVDARLYFDGKLPRYDIVVAPGGNPADVKLAFPGADSLSLKNSHEVLVQTQFGQISMGDLQAYQIIGKTKRKVSSSFKLDSGALKFNVGPYDKTKPLIIDPVLYSTLLGGTGSFDQCLAITADLAGSSYVTGTTAGNTFPTSLGAIKETPSAVNAFATKFNRDGSAVLYSTRIGGTNATIEQGRSIVVDSSGNAIIGGETNATDFPAGATPGPKTTFGGGTTDGFIIKINATGSQILWSTYVGGTGADTLPRIALDASGNIHFAGQTSTTNLTTLNAPQLTYGGGATDLYYGTLNAAGSAFTQMGYLGGNGGDTYGGFALNPVTGTKYIAATTSSTDYPVTAGAYDTSLQNALNTLTDAAVSAIRSNGTYLYSTAIGGNNNDIADGIGVDSDGNAYLTGRTDAFDYPTTIGAYSRSWTLARTMFVTKFNPTGSGLVYSTFLANGGLDTLARVNNVAVDSLGSVYLIGSANTLTANNVLTGILPLRNQDQAYIGASGLYDAFLLTMNPTGSDLYYTSPFGGNLNEFGNDVYVDGNLGVYICGTTFSVTGANQIPFPTTPGAYKPANPIDGFSDGFVMKLKVRPLVEIANFVVNPTSVIGGLTPFPTATVTLTVPAPAGGVTVTLSSSSPTAALIQNAVVIPEGSTTSGPVPISTSAELNLPVDSILTATYITSSKTATLRVSPWLDTLNISALSSAGGNALTGTVTLSAPAPTNGLVVNLTSSNTSAATVPATVTVPGGSTSATFTVTTIGVTASTSLTIQAQVESATRTANLTVTPAVMQSFVITPGRVSGGDVAQGFVTLDGVSPDPITISFTTNRAGAVPAPGFVIIPAGQRTTTDPIQIQTNTVSGTVTATIGAVKDTQTLTAFLTVENTTLASLTFDINPAKSGDNVTATVTLGSAAPAGGSTVLIDQTGGDTSAVTLPTSVSIPGGSTSATFPIVVRSIATTSVVTVRGRIGTNAVTGTLTVNGVALSGLSVNPTSVLAGAGSTGTVTLDTQAPTGGLTVTLASSNTDIAASAVSVLVPAGLTTATFPITSGPKFGTATFTATLGSVTKTAALQVRAISLTGLTFNPGRVRGGSRSSTVTVTIESPAPAGGYTFNLIKSNNYVTLFATQYTIPAGATSYTFNVGTNRVSRNLSSTITATASERDGSSSVAGSLTITR